MSDKTAILLIACQDKNGLVARVAGFINEYGGNILDSDHHTDRGTGDFLMRTVFVLEGFQLPSEDISDAFRPLAKIHNMQVQWYFSDHKPKVGILVSQYDHCLVDVLQRYRRSELAIEIPAIISNHQTAAWWADHFHIPFHHCPVTAETKSQQEEQVLSILREQKLDLVVLARYMQIVSERFLDQVG
jgi:formyltetrahydrofolate deformylase